MMSNNNNNNNNNTAELAIPQDYEQSSKYFRHYWNDIAETTDLAKKEMINMVTALEKAGFSRTQAIQKIIDDHKDLNGFSRRTIYRQLPDNQKRKYDFTNVKPNVPNGTFVVKEQEEREREAGVGQAVDEVYDSLDEYEQNTQQEPTATIDDEDPQYQDVIYDAEYVKRLEQENQELKQIFSAPGTYEGRDQDLPLIIKVDPENKKILKTELDKVRAKELAR
jgi:hypothetical protein